MKKAIFFLLVLLTSFTFTGCGEDGYDYTYKGLPSTENTGNNEAGVETNANKTIPTVSAYTSIEKAQSAIGFIFTSPTKIPNGYSLDEISVVKDGETSFAQINYVKESNNITYRVSANTDALNADRNTYDKEKEILVSDTTILCQCNADITYVATWQKDNCFYCIMSDEGLDTTNLSIIISSIQ